MGGGGVMRAASKVAGLPGFTTAFRAGAAATDTPVTVAARVASAVRSDQPRLVIEQRPVCELDDWVLADDGFGTDSNSRLVFGPVPSLDETKEATAELKEAIEQVYLSSPKSAGSVGSLHETKACITQESSVPVGAMHAFKLLKESPTAQNVVASVASDPNVWNAVLANLALKEFLQSDESYTGLETREPKGSVEAEVDTQDSSSTTSFIDNDDVEEPGKPDGFMGFVEEVKVTVVDMVGKLTSFVESMFTLPEEKTGAESFDSPRAFIAGGSFMALAMMVIMVVLMKRN